MISNKSFILISSKLDYQLNNKSRYGMPVSMLENYFPDYLTFLLTDFNI